MRRIYFLAPNIKTTHGIVDELRALGLQDNSIHVLGQRDTPLEDLPEAGISIKTDFVAAAERGIALGGSAGLLAGLIALRFSGFALAGGPILGVLFAGATIGSLAGGLTGLNVGNSKLKQFENAIEAGQLLILVDVPKDQIKSISQQIIKHHPNAEYDGIEPILPPSH